MDELKKNSINVSKPTVACWPQYGGREETLDMADVRLRYNGKFCVNNSTICFVLGYEAFVTPYTRRAMALIRKAGLTKDYFHVPFSNWDYPKEEAEKWRRLRELAKESRYRDYENDSAKWCDEHGVGKLSEEILNRCFKMPRSGVSVKHPYFEGVHYPVCHELCVDAPTIDVLGRYCTNNGKVVFVYRDGHTYVAKGYWILDELRQAGYKESGLFVPFSNGEQITDARLAYEWERVPKK